MHKRVSMSQGILRRFVYREISLKSEEQNNRTDKGKAKGQRQSIFKLQVQVQRSNFGFLLILPKALTILIYSKI